MRPAPCGKTKREMTDRGGGRGVDVDVGMGVMQADI